MEVVVETPKWSFVKYRLRDGAYEADMWSPLPTPFNYGFVKGTLGADGLPKDAIILGRKLRRGAVVEANEVGVVNFMDDGVEDNKIIAVREGWVTVKDRVIIHLFFASYMLFKIVYYALKERKLAACYYRGITLSAN